MPMHRRNAVRRIGVCQSLFPFWVSHPCTIEASQYTLKLPMNSRPKTLAKVATAYSFNHP